MQNYSEVKGDLLGHIFSGSGLVWYGGAIGGALFVVLWAWWRDFLNLTLLDVAAPALALGMRSAAAAASSPATATTASRGTGRGRWPTNGTEPTKVPVHPTPVYETLAMGLGAWILGSCATACGPGASSRST